MDAKHIICAAKYCENTLLERSDLTFFTFPENEDLATTWARNANILNYDHGATLCSEHFEDKYFDDRYDKRMVFKTSIKPIPTKFHTDVDANANAKGPNYGSDDEIINVTLDFEKNPFIQDNFIVENEFKKKVDNNIDKHIYCRLCAELLPSNKLFPINGYPDNYSTLLEMCLPEKFSNTDDLPQHICSPCINDLESCSMILIAFIDADRKLRKIKTENKVLEVEDSTSNQTTSAASSFDNTENILPGIERYETAISAQNSFENISLETENNIPETSIQTILIPSSFENTDIISQDTEICIQGTAISIQNSSGNVENTSLDTDNNVLQSFPKTTFPRSFENIEAEIYVPETSNETNSSSSLFENVEIIPQDTEEHGPRTSGHTTFPSPSENIETDIYVPEIYIKTNSSPNLFENIENIPQDTEEHVPGASGRTTFPSPFENIETEIYVPEIYIKTNYSPNVFENVENIPQDTEEFVPGTSGQTTFPSPSENIETEICGPEISNETNSCPNLFENMENNPQDTEEHVPGTSGQTTLLSPSENIETEMYVPEIYVKTNYSPNLFEIVENIPQDTEEVVPRTSGQTTFPSLSENIETEINVPETSNETNSSPNLFENVENIPHDTEEHVPVTYGQTTFPSPSENIATVIYVPEISIKTNSSPNLFENIENIPHDTEEVVPGISGQTTFPSPSENIETEINAPETSNETNFSPNLFENLENIPQNMEEHVPRTSGQTNFQNTSENIETEIYVPETSNETNYSPNLFENVENIPQHTEEHVPGTSGQTTFPSPCENKVTEIYVPETSNETNASPTVFKNVENIPHDMEELVPETSGQTSNLFENLENIPQDTEEHVAGTSGQTNFQSTSENIETEINVPETSNETNSSPNLFEDLENIPQNTEEHLPGTSVQTIFPNSVENIESSSKDTESDSSETIYEISSSSSFENIPTKRENQKIKYQCVLCPSVFNSKEDIIIHLYYVHPKSRRYKIISKVIKPNANTTTQNKIKEYISENIFKKFKCVICSAVFNTKENVSAHADNEHKILSRENILAKIINVPISVKYMCVSCPTIYESRKEVIDHAQLFHPANKIVSKVVLIETNEMKHNPPVNISQNDTLNVPEFRNEIISPNKRKRKFLQFQKKHIPHSFHVNGTTPRRAYKRFKFDENSKPIQYFDLKFECQSCSLLFNNYKEYRDHSDVFNKTDTPATLVKVMNNVIINEPNKDNSLKNDQNDITRINDGTIIEIDPVIKYEISNKKIKSKIVKQTRYKCMKCPKLFRSTKILIQHALSVHPTSGVNEIRYKLVKVNKKLTNLTYLSTDRYECLICSSLHISKISIIQHTRIFHSSICNEKFLCRFHDVNFKVIRQCLHCNMELANFDNYRIHIDNHVSFSCEKCDSKFNRSKDLRLHLKEHMRPK